VDALLQSSNSSALKKKRKSNQTVYTSTGVSLPVERTADSKDPLGDCKESLYSVYLHELTSLHMRTSLLGHGCKMTIRKASDWASCE